ncbi:MAG TPA: hypothetical protein [Caudoviricetes sp.]|nr:MAG TPA: hypothetical protein [Caudoviricetes sp.]
MMPELMTKNILDGLVLLTVLVVAPLQKQLLVSPLGILLQLLFHLMVNLLGQVEDISICL